MTARGRWLLLLALSGTGLGLLRDQVTLTVLSLTILVWLFLKWVSFHTRLWFEAPKIRVRRMINGRESRRRYLWAGRTLTITVEVESFAGRVPSWIHLRDCLPENFRLEAGRCDRLVVFPENKVRFEYTALAAGSGSVQLPGFRITLTDPHGFYSAERFVAAEQTFRVLPSYAEVAESETLVKRINAIPQHGIHRLQRAGMGSELLELREYVAGDPPKSIAWKVSARRDTLMTRQYESEVPVRVFLFVDGSISTRIGGFGHRLLDQMLFVASSVARSAVSVGDPVGACLFDERGTRRVAAAGGERGFYQLLEAFSDFAAGSNPPTQKLTPGLLNAALRLAGERYPELMDPRLNQAPFTFLPLSPWKRRRLYQRTLLANLLAQQQQLSPLELMRIVEDDAVCARYAQQFLADGGVAWMDPLIENRQRGFYDGMATMEMFSRTISSAVGRARDNEVYVVMANLLECATNVSHMLPAVKLALARHHRVIFVCPTPAFQRPGEGLEAVSTTENSDPTAEEMLQRAEALRVQELANRLKRSLRRLGASVAFSGDEASVRMVLSEAELARSGRSAAKGVR